MGQKVAPKEGHKHLGKRGEPFIKGQQCGFAGNCIPDEHHHKINEVVLAKTRSCEAHPVLDRFQDSRMLENLSKGCHFLEYIIMPLSLIVWLVEAIREAVSHLLLSSIPSRASFWPAVLQ